MARYRGDGFGHLPQISAEDRGKLERSPNEEM
jgi:hypothetical protein